MDGERRALDVQLETLGGTVLDGKYQIESQLGEGGMGAVFLATHLGTKRTVALKVIIPRSAGSAAFAERFRLEAEASGSLRHPNIVDVTDFGIAQLNNENIAYLVMEYLDGCTLAEVLAEEKFLPLEWAVDILEQVCAGIGEAHRKGIIHRDLKPGNIWLEPNRHGGYTVKVLDFGLAKVNESKWNDGSYFDGAGMDDALDEQDAPISYTELGEGEAQPDFDEYRAHVDEEPSSQYDEEPSSLPVTQIGTVVGTPQYMSPEQCRSEPLDPRADIYSLGIIAYEMLAGERPFQGEPIALMLKHVVEKPKPLRERRPNIPPLVSDLIMQALEKTPDARPYSASVFANTLRAASATFGSLLQRAMGLCIAKFGVFMRLFLVAYAPLIYVQVIKLLVMLQAYKIDPSIYFWWSITAMVLASIAAFFGASVTRGVSALLLTQIIRTPLARVRYTLALGVMRRRRGDLFVGSLFYVVFVTMPFFIFLMTISQASAIAARGIDVGGSMLDVGVGVLLTAIGVVSGYISFRNLVTYSLFPVVLLVEGKHVREGLKRSNELVSRDRRSLYPVAIIEVGMVLVIFGLSTALIMLIHNYFVEQTVVFAISLALELFANSLTAILYAMLYMNLRQLGGESLRTILDNQYVKQDLPRTKWLERMQSRSMSRRRSGKHPAFGSKPHSTGSSSRRAVSGPQPLVGDDRERQ